MGQAVNCKRCGVEIIEAATGRRPVYCSDRCRKNAFDTRTGRNLRPNRAVFGIDSETVNDAAGHARLVLIACSDGGVIEGDPITSAQALDFIVSRQGELWTYFGDYDINFWLADWPLETLDRLRRENWARHEGWRVHHIPRRVFDVWHKPTGRHARIYDAFPFAQRSFVSWLEEWQLAGTEEIESLRAMKEQRAEFSKLSRSEIRRYTLHEVECIARGVAALKERVQSAGCKPAQWLGPGAVAAVVLRRNRVNDYKPLVTVREAERAYYGGRIETAAVGMVPGPLFYYDIASAYPAATRELPCFRHGEWRKQRKAPEAGAVALVSIAWRPKSHRGRPIWGPFPVRKRKGDSLRYYAEGSGVYWWHEVEPWLQRESPVVVRIRSARVWHRECSHAPFAWVEELYDRRVALKRAGDPGEYALKLVLNSIYGKLAQKIGRAPFQCFEWAGMITAATRARIAELLIRYPRDVMIVATDGAIATRELDILPEDESRLGAWSFGGRFKWADVWQPGFYILSDGKVRTRGFTRRDVNVQAFRREWRARTLFGRVPVSRNRVIGYRAATSRGTLKDFCRWDTEESEVSFLPGPRRVATSHRILRGRDMALRTVAPANRAEDSARALPEDMRRIRDYLDDGEPQGFLRD